MATTLVSDTMVKYPYFTRPEQPVAEALDEMREKGARHLPVVAGTRLVGLVSDRDLRAAAASQSGAFLTCGEVMQRDVYVVDRFTPLSVVAADMAEGKFGSALVVDHDRNLVGIFTTTDALRLLSERLGDEDFNTVFTVREERRPPLDSAF